MSQPPFQRTTPIITALTHSIPHIVSALIVEAGGGRQYPPPRHTSLKSWWVMNECNVQSGRCYRLIRIITGSHKHGGGYQTGCYVWVWDEWWSHLSACGSPARVQTAWLVQRHCGGPAGCADCSLLHWMLPATVLLCNTSTLTAFTV